MAKNDLVRRQEAVAKTIAKFRDKPFVWGEQDCGKLLLSHLAAMGHKKLAKPGRYKDALGARRALTAMGFETVEDWLDSLLPRIAPAAALPGDIVVVQGDAGLDCITISVGFKAFGWHEDAPGATILIHREVKGAWRG
jgi:hypothetical protein